MLPFALSPRQTFAANVVRLARDRITGVLFTLAGDPTTDRFAADAIHDARKELKRLRALLRLARAGLGEQTFRRENAAARDAGRELSSVRDAQVLVKAFDALKDALHKNVAPETLGTADDRLRADAKDALTALHARDRVPRAAALLSAARERIDAWPWHGGEDDWRVPRKGLAKVYRAARRAMRRAADSGDEGDFHEWRKQVKHLDAHAKLLGPLSPRKSNTLDRNLGKLADQLGEAHDLSVLAVRLARYDDPALPAADLAKINHRLEADRARLRKKALRRGERFFRDRTGRFVRHWSRKWEARRTLTGN